MANVRITHNAAGYYQLRSAPGVRADLESRGGRVKRSASSDGGKYVMSSQQGVKAPQGRWRVSIATADVKAMRRNAKNHSLLRALDSGR